MGKLGAEGVLAELAARGTAGGSAGVRLLTHCNTGSLATAAYGTALGVVRGVAEAGRLEHAFCTETRPYNQGAAFPPPPLSEYHAYIHHACPLFQPLDSSCCEVLRRYFAAGAPRIHIGVSEAIKLYSVKSCCLAAEGAVPGDLKQCSAALLQGRG